MAQNVTAPTTQDAERFLKTVEMKRRREDGQMLLSHFREWTGMEPVIWANGLAGNPGSGIIGFGHYDYKYKSGRKGSWFLTGFSPRKANMSIYIMPGFDDFKPALARLGPHKHSVSCLYVTNLAKIDLGALEEIVRGGLAIMKERYDWRAQ